VRNVVVVGASLAGLRAVETLRHAGYDGRLALVGAEPHLPYDRPPLSKQLLAGTAGLELLVLREAARYDELALDLHLGRTATRLDPREPAVVLDDGTRLAFDGLVIATGAAPRRLPRTPDVEGIHVLRTLDDCLALADALAHRPRVVVVGAGFIGSEVAATAYGRGCHVTVLEALPVPLGRVLGDEMGKVCGALHTAHGVDVRCGAAVEAIEGDGRVERVRLADGTALEADAVLVAVGVSPATAWLEGSGVELSDGVVCDTHCFARGAPEGAVVAAGDVARWDNPLFGGPMRIEHWTNAAEQGAIAASNLLAGPRDAEEFAPVPYFWSDQYDVKIQYVGHTRPDDEVRVVHGSVDDAKFVVVYGRDGLLTGALGFNRPRQLMTYRRLLARRATWEDALAAAESA
jgi:NADPH-dependent 2,4-dienoyl-CoA reductase/sulfur reductase-like enzyme